MGEGRPRYKDCDACGEPISVAPRGRVPQWCPACRESPERAAERAAEATRVANEVADRLTARLWELQKLPQEEREARLAQLMAERDYGEPRKRRL